ncbi:MULTISPECIES: helix-turn-helix domain-containing protein [unclassified Streptomyces]|uniref:XRE family transcriptional regulator n=1 Tax=Streptomyces sp. gb1(2016) TaxID=1828321 RepID=A0A652KK71_9ACTN|nr:MULTISPECIES: helix-turn-helix transcriptional regulator [unclassified Streptomyces]MDX3428958.1 helix-turn-helix transcriptional regulator [Streptomyces sp. ME01-18a]TXS24052.1 XRE family transcriptional regulator [Streptomyces sp. gb1(2016)]WSS62087.1 helix-turn-helix transcriptional regulator [Streptomyces sp. NBC_01177]
MASDNGGGGQCGEPESSDSLKTFGAVLKALRDEAHLTQEQFAPRVQYSAAYIAKIEQGKRFPPRDLLDRSEEVLGPAAARVLAAAARSLTRKVGLASWFLQWAAIEEGTTSLYAYECRVIPGLLQPEPYIHALFERHLPPLTQDQFERQVAARLARQQLLIDRPNTSFSFVIEQALLERRLGGAQVTVALLDHLLLVGRYRNVEIQVMPLVQEDHAGFEGEMYLAETADHRWAGYVEGHGSSMLITDAEAASYMLQRYGKMRSQALSHQDTTSLLEQMRGER